MVCFSLKNCAISKTRETVKIMMCVYFPPCSNQLRHSLMNYKIGLAAATQSRKIFKLKRSPVCFKSEKSTVFFAKSIKRPAGRTLMNRPYHVPLRRSFQRPCRCCQQTDLQFQIALYHPDHFILKPDNPSPQISSDPVFLPSP